jgi:hypothetical protein
MARQRLPSSVKIQAIKELEAVESSGGDEFVLNAR